MIGSELSAMLLMMFLLFEEIILCPCRSDIIFICLNSLSEYHLALSQISLRRISLAVSATGGTRGLRFRVEQFPI